MSNSKTILHVWWKCLILLPVLVNSCSSDTKVNEKRIVCYYTNWSVYRPTSKFTPKDIDPYLCTHLVYAFGGFDDIRGIKPYDSFRDIDEGGYAEFNELKTINTNLKTLIAIGGESEGPIRFSRLGTEQVNRQIFIQNAIEFLRKYDFDGLDLYWKYPGAVSGSTADDKKNYLALTKEFNEEFKKEAESSGKPRLLLTMAVPPTVENIDKGYDIPQLNKYLDFMNVLSYDYHKGNEKFVTHHQPLYPIQGNNGNAYNPQLTVDHTIRYYLKLGADRNKLVVGIATFGHTYTLQNSSYTDFGSPANGPGDEGFGSETKGFLGYYEVCRYLKENEWKVVHRNSTAVGPYAYFEDQWVNYDDEDIITKKAEYVNRIGLGGIMFNSVDNDDFKGECHGKPYPLIEAGRSALLAGGSSGKSQGNPKVAKDNKNRPPLTGLSSTKPKFPKDATFTPATQISIMPTTSNEAKNIGQDQDLIQLFNLIQKLGGIREVEKRLMGSLGQDIGNTRAVNNGINNNQIKPTEFGPTEKSTTTEVKPVASTQMEIIVKEEPQMNLDDEIRTRYDEKKSKFPETSPSTEQVKLNINNPGNTEFLKFPIDQPKESNKAQNEGPINKESGVKVTQYNLKNSDSSYIQISREIVPQGREYEAQMKTSTVEFGGKLQVRPFILIVNRK